MAKRSRKAPANSSETPAKPAPKAEKPPRQKRASALPKPAPSPVKAPPAATAPQGFMEAIITAKKAEQEANRRPPGFFAKTGLLLAQVILVLLALSPAWFTAKLVATYAVNTPFGDDWNLVDHLESLHHDHLEWSELCQPVDGERAPLPQFLHLIAIRLSGGDLRVDAWMNLGWIALTSLGVLLLLLRTVRSGFGVALLYFIANLALFSPAQNLFALRQAGILIPVACLVWAHLFASFHFSSVVKFGACVLLSCIAASSGIYGLALLLTVPVLACFAVGMPCRMRPVIFAAAWGVFALVVLKLYFLSWNPFSGLFTPVPEGIESSPRLERGFAIAFKLLSSPLIEGWGWAGPGARVALGAGLTAMLLGMAAWTLVSTIGQHRPLSGVRCSPWLLLGMSGLVGIALIAITRLAASPLFDSPSSSIHLGHAAIPVLLGTLAPFYLLIREWIHRIQPHLLRLAPALLLASVSGSVIGLQSESWFRGQEITRFEHHQRLRARVALHLSNCFPPNDATSFGTTDPATLARRARFLHDSGYLNPLLLHQAVWPDRRVSTEALTLLQARVDEGASRPPSRFRIIARIPGNAGKLEPAAGLLIAAQDPFDPMQHRLLASGTPDPADLAGWLLDLPGGDIAFPRLEFWAIDGQSMIAHRLDSILVRAEGDAEWTLQRPSTPTAEASAAPAPLSNE